LWWQIPYIWKRRADGLYVINLAKTWEKLMLAARIIVAIENPNDGVCRTRVEQAQNGWRRAAVAPGPRASNTLAPGGKSVHGFPAHTLLSALPLCEVGAARAARAFCRFMCESARANHSHNPTPLVLKGGVESNVTLSWENKTKNCGGP
jgi:hypothetical protein